MQQRPLGWLVMAGLVGLGLAGGVFYWRHPPQSSPSAVSTTPPLTLKGAAVEGSLLSAADSQGHSFNLKLETAEVDPKDGAGEVYLYTVLYQPTPHLPWQNLCAPDAEGVAKALPLTGQWDAKGNYTPQGITLACTNGALAKCVRWGYKPWKTDQDIPWRDLHQACTRMVRADYCGDGVSHTQQGVNIDIYDDFGIQRRTPQSGMVFEAAWGPQGAVAVNRTRIPASMAQVRQQCPDRLKPLPPDVERDLNLQNLQSYSSGALIFNDSFIKPKIGSSP